jgi:hypothetical protein
VRVHEGLAHERVRTHQARGEAAHALAALLADGGRARQARGLRRAWGGRLRHELAEVEAARSDDLHRLPAEVAPEGEVDVLLTFEGARDDDRAVWLYPDAGGFLDASVGAPDADDVARSTYFAPAKPKELVNLWFIGVDGLGGVALLSHQLAVTGG